MTRPTLPSTTNGESRRTFILRHVIHPRSYVVHRFSSVAMSSILGSKSPSGTLLCSELCSVLLRKCSDALYKKQTDFL